MKNIISIILLIFIKYQCQAQCFGNEGCTNGTTTDVTQPCPATNDFHQNTFDWRLPAITSVSKASLPSFSTSYPLTNPYFTSGSQAYISAIALGYGSDYQPSDGWELVKQDFGYYYGNNQWDGTTIQSQLATTGVANSSLAYFMLYNKYTGVLRIFADFPFSGQAYENIEVTLSFMSGDISSSSTSNWANYKPSALFNMYDTLMQALDKPTYKNSVSTFAKFVTDQEHFCWADFQLSYDPCACFFEQGIHVSFKGIQTANLTLTGRYEGVASNDPNVLLVNNGTGSIYGESVLDNYLSSVLNTDNGGPQYTANDIIAIEKTVANASTDIAYQYNSAAAAATMGLFFTAISAVAAGSAATAENKDLAGSIKDDAASLATAVNLFSTALTPNTQTYVMFGGLALQGTSYQSTDLNGVEYSFATPGSSNASTRPEYAGAASGGQLPNAPIYNEIPGLIGLKKTPSVNRFIGPASSFLNFGDIVYQGQRSAELQDVNKPMEYQFDQSSLEVLYSPYVNPTTTQIYAALEIGGIPLSTTVFATETQSGQTISICPIFSLASVTNMTDITGTTAALNNSNHTYITPFVPINCLSQIIGQEMINFNGVPSIAASYFNNLSNQEIVLVLQVYFEFNENAYGKKKRTFQILKFPLNINDVTTQLSTQPQFAELANIPNNLTLSSLPSTLPTDGIIYSQGTITITGNLTLPSGSSPIIIRAQNGINVNPGVTIGPGITLQIQSFLPICDNFSSAAITPVTVDATFCNSSNYQANQALQKLNIPDTTKAIANSNFAINLYPNPTNSDCTVRFTESSVADVTITLIDITGREVATIDHSWHSQGTSYVPFSTDRYAPGVYTVRFSDGTNTSTQRLTITGK